MRQVLGPGTLARPRGIGWRGRWEGELGWGIYVTPWLIHVNVWQNTLKCEVISLQLIKINEKKKKKCIFNQSYEGGLASLIAQLVKNPPRMQETWVWSLDLEDPPEKGKATHSSIPIEFHGLYNPWDRREWDKTEQLSLERLSLHCLYFMS